MASAVSDNVNKHVTSRELGAFRNLKYSEVVNITRGGGAFIWTLLVNTVNTIPFEGTINIDGILIDNENSHYNC